MKLQMFVTLNLTVCLLLVTIAYTRQTQRLDAARQSEQEARTAYLQAADQLHKERQQFALEQEQQRQRIVQLEAQASRLRRIIGHGAIFPAGTLRSVEQLRVRGDLTSQALR